VTVDILIYIHIYYVYIRQAGKCDTIECACGVSPKLLTVLHSQKQKKISL